MSGMTVLILVGLFMVLIILGVITQPSTQHRYEAEAAWFREHGVRFEAYITEIQKQRGSDNSLPNLLSALDVLAVGNKSWNRYSRTIPDTYLVIAMVEQPETGKWYTFMKRVYKEGLTRYKTGRKVIVYMDSKNPKRYLMEDIMPNT